MCWRAVFMEVPVMNDDFSRIWQEQETQGVSISAAEVRQRAQRLRESLMRRRGIGIAATVLCLASSAASLLIFPSPRTFVWFGAAQLVLWTITIILLPDILRVTVE